MIYAPRELRWSTVARGHQGLNPWISTIIRGRSSVGRAVDWSSARRWFESIRPHQKLCYTKLFVISRVDENRARAQRTGLQSIRLTFTRGSRFSRVSKTNNSGKSCQTTKAERQFSVGHAPCIRLRLWWSSPSWLRPRIVIPVCVGSNPTDHPKIW